MPFASVPPKAASTAERVIVPAPDDFYQPNRWKYLTAFPIFSVAMMAICSGIL